jgi:SAM-dependent methyltransferase
MERGRDSGVSSAPSLPGVRNKLARRLIKATAGRAYNAVYGLRHRGAASRYCMVPGYRHRESASYFDDTENTDHWQREVYLYAQTRMREQGLRLVYDVGCGSGFKLLGYLGAFETIGFDMPETVQFLRKKYPERRWEVSDFAERHPSPDLVICSDVIEHVPDPDELVAFIKRLRPRSVILSTPERNLFYAPGSPYRFGPPTNPAHFREWSFDEFGAYIAREFAIREHLVTNREQATQMIYCTPKGT